MTESSALSVANVNNKNIVTASAAVLGLIGVSTLAYSVV